MTPRTLAAAVVDEVTHTDRFAKDALDQALRGSGLTGADRRLAAELVYGTLRWWTPLTSSIRRALDKPGKKLDRKLLSHLVVAAYQLHHLDERIPAHAAVHEAVEAVKQDRRGLAGLANAVLRNLGSPPHAMLPADADPDALAAAFGVPRPLVDAVTAGLAGAARLDAVAALNARPRRALTWLGPASAVPQSLAPHTFVAGAYLAEHFDEEVDRALAAGRAQVQDPGSRAVVNLCAAEAGQAVLDLCAAPGTKTRGLAAAVGPTGRVVAVDVNKRRAARIKDHFGPDDPVEVIVGDGAQPGLLEGQRFDVVLVDAPCTGFGTTRRRPEIKLRRSGADERLLDVQRRLLDAAAARVKPGGTLVYAVCSPLPAEGAAVAAAFVDRTAGFVRERAEAVLPGLPKDAQDDAGQLQLRPHRHDADGFFAVRFRRGSA